jgi:uncharacterized integral membrane protein
MTLPSEDRSEQELAPRPPDYATGPPMPDSLSPVTDPSLTPEPIPATEPGGELGGTGRHTPARVPRTRIGAAWIGVWAGVLVVILLIIFIGQNTADVKVNFLWMDGNIPTALALLIAGVGGAIIAMAIAAARIIQLRRLVRRR